MLRDANVAGSRRVRRPAGGRWPLAAGAFGVLLAAAAALGVLAGRYDSFVGDLWLARRAQETGPVGRDVAAVFNVAGGPAVLPPLWVAVSLILAHRRRWDAVALTGLAGGAWGLAEGLRYLVDRPRPSAELVSTFETLDSPGFPSGHVSGVALLAGALWLANQGGALGPHLRWLLRLVTLVVVFGSAFSRVTVGAHWPSDTYGAMVWAAVLLWAIRWGVGQLASRRPVAQAMRNR